MKNFNLFNKKIIILFCFLFFLILLFFLNDKKDDVKIVNNKCNFELLDIKISKYHKDGPDLDKIKELEEELKTPCPYNDPNDNKIDTCKISRPRITSALNQEKNSKDKLTWVEIEGMIKLNGTKSEQLDTLIFKIYTDDDRKIFLGDGYISARESIAPDTSYPFQISITLDRNKELIGKYFSKDDEIKVDVYPYFSSCEY